MSNFLFDNIASSINKRLTGPNGHLSVMYERGVDETQSTYSTSLSTNLLTTIKKYMALGWGSRPLSI